METLGIGREEVRVEQQDCRDDLTADGGRWRWRQYGLEWWRWRFLWWQEGRRWRWWWGRRW